MELKIDPKRLRETIRNDFKEAKPRRSKKKDTKARKIDQRETQESPKSEGVKACQPFGVDLEAPKGSQEIPKSTQKRPKEAYGGPQATPKGTQKALPGKPDK